MFSHLNRGGIKIPFGTPNPFYQEVNEKSTPSFTPHPLIPQIKEAKVIPPLALNQ
jgi:hypothetical protein